MRDEDARGGHRRDVYGVVANAMSCNDTQTAVGARDRRRLNAGRIHVQRVVLRGMLRCDGGNDFRQILPGDGARAIELAECRPAERRFASTVQDVARDADAPMGCHCRVVSVTRLRCAGSSIIPFMRRP